MDTLATDIARSLRVAADWLDAHPDLRPEAVTAYKHGATVSFRVADDAALDELMALIDLGSRWDYHYDEGDHRRIAGGRIDDGVSLSVAVPVEVTC